MRHRNRNRSHQQSSPWDREREMNYSQEPSSYDANYGSSRWGSGRRDQYDGPRFRDTSYGSSSYGSTYGRNDMSDYRRPSNYSEGGHGMERYGRSTRRENSYNDEFDHDYENHPQRPPKEDRWADGSDLDRARNERDFQQRDQARHQGRGYAERADRDRERYESDTSMRNFQPYSSNSEHMQDDWSSQDRYRNRPRENDPFYYGSE